MKDITFGPRGGLPLHPFPKKGDGGESPGLAKVPGVAPWGMSIDALLARAEAGGGTPVESLTPFPAIYGGSQRGAI